MMEVTPRRRRPLFERGNRPGWTTVTKDKPTNGDGAQVLGGQGADPVVREMQDRTEALDITEHLSALALGQGFGDRDAGSPGRTVEVILPFTGRRRSKMTRTCACGCGRQFSTTFPDKRYLTDAHRKRADRRMSAHVQG